MSKSFFGSITVLSFCALALVIANIFLFSSNRGLQQQATVRQQEINSGVQINQLNNQMIQMIAQTSGANQDDQLRSLLLDNGVTFEFTPSTDGAPSPVSAPGDTQ